MEISKVAVGVLAAACVAGGAGVAYLARPSDPMPPAEQALALDPLGVEQSEATIAEPIAQALAPAPVEPAAARPAPRPAPAPRRESYPSASAERNGAVLAKRRLPASSPWPRTERRGHP